MMRKSPRRRKTNAEAKHAADLAARLSVDMSKYIPSLDKVIYFTRDALVEGLREAPMWGDYPAVSRYIMVCQAVTHLLETGKLVSGSNRTDLVWPERRGEYTLQRRGGPMHKHYIELIQKILATHSFPSVADIVDTWEQSHATIAAWMAPDAKRVVVRLALREMLREGMVEMPRPDVYKLNRA